MSTRTSSAGLLLLLLGACGTVPDKAAEVRRAETRRAMARAEGRVPCAVGPHRFAPVCTIDRTETQDGLFLTMRHPDGGFHRLLVTTDGRGVVAADGAEPARVRPLGATAIEVALGPVRYVLPATVGSAKAR